VARYGQLPCFIPGTQVGPVPVALGNFDVRMPLSSSIIGMGDGGWGRGGVPNEGRIYALLNKGGLYRYSEG
jgi:hypothetical protein